MHVTRRAFLTDLGKGVSAAVVVTACSTGTPSPSTTGPTTSVALPTASTSPPASASSTTGDVEAAPDAGLYSWSRVDLDFVSAYLLVRNGEAVVVDTGVANSEGAIEGVLSQLGLGWDAASHVIITHEHPDHAGSVRAVLDLAPDATGYAAEPDLGNIASSRPLTAVVDGDVIEGLRIIATPGHTDGHVSVLDPGRILLTGDAINNVDGVLTGANPQFSSDMAAADASAKLLAGFDYEVALFGHGVPIEQGASRRVAELAASL